jgi:hypothetical protein
MEEDVNLRGVVLRRLPVTMVPAPETRHKSTETRHKSPAPETRHTSMETPHKSSPRDDDVRKQDGTEL